MVERQITWNQEFVGDKGVVDLARVEDHLDSHHPGWKDMPSFGYSVLQLHREQHEHMLLCHPGLKELAEILPGEFTMLRTVEHSWHHAADGILTKLLERGTTVYTSPHSGVSTSQPRGTMMSGGDSDH